MTTLTTVKEAVLKVFQVEIRSYTTHAGSGGECVHDEEVAFEA